LKRTGASLVVYALEQLGVRYTFGIPGVHNTEIYDELNKSEQITPVLVTHEGGASFMADAVSRVSDSTGTLVLVPAAGLTHAASGIGEAFVDGVPMLIISGGVRTDLPYRYQLHQIDMHPLLAGLTKKTYLIERHEDIVPTLLEAYRIAHDGEPGPVYIEIPVNLQLFPGEISSLPPFQATPSALVIAPNQISDAVEMLRKAKRPGLFVGWGARHAREQLIALAERLETPVATTLQGLSVFPANHPLHTGFGFGPAAVPAARNAFRDCDCLVAIGTRFAEIATGSFGVQVPENLIHIDINPDALNANYPAKVAIQGDATAVLDALLHALPQDMPPQSQALRSRIQADKAAYLKEWFAHDSGDRINPGHFFSTLRRQLDDEDFVVVDDGNHTYLTAELMPIHRAAGFICPTDFNCMGYAVPAAIATKLCHPDRRVATIVGDGAFMMTCMEIVTATTLKLGVIYYVFNDGELAQIAQAQQVTYNRTPCTQLGQLNLEGVALATGAHYLALDNAGEIEAVMAQANEVAASGRPVVVNVKIDYSKPTCFTKGAVKTNFSRFPLGMKMRFAGRALWRKVLG